MLKPWFVKTSNCKFFIDAKYYNLGKGTSGIHNQLIRSPDDYEKKERLLVSKYLPQEASVLELGGRVGVVSCVVNKILKNPNKHVVLEIESFWHRYLEINRRINKCKFKSILGQVTDTTNNPYVNSYWRSKKTIDINLFEFDTLISDIEGAEYSLFDQNKWMFEKLKTIIIELHPPNSRIKLQVEEFLNNGWILKEVLETCYVFIK